MASPKHRAVRPRYGRLTALGASAAVVAVALLASAGGWGDRSAPSAHAPGDVPTSAAPSPLALSSRHSKGSSTTPSASASASSVDPAPPRDPNAVPADTGSGRRIVFDQSAQRIWLVGAEGRASRTYLGSGSLIDNLRPGTYSVYSRSRWAVGLDDSGVMQYFVRFTRGPEGGAIGFHSIPTKDGVPLQQVSQLGTPQSHGCIRQRTKDAIALWDFAPVGTKVVVVA